MLIDLGFIDYEEAYKIQKDLVIKRKAGVIEDTVILAEHAPVFTIGRTGKRENIFEDDTSLARRAIKVLRVERGGDVTFHGPGQLVGYPVIDLKRRGKDLHKYLRSLEDVVIRFLNCYSVAGQRRQGKTGVWVEDKKISSIGIAATDWVTFHGLSINVNMDLSFFSMMRPCGMSDIEVTSLDRVLRRRIDIAQARNALAASFCDLFGMGRRDVG